MTTLTSPSNAATRQPATRSAAGSDRWIYLGLTLLVTASWALVKVLDLQAASDLGYWLGVVGGVMMLLLFAYPMRKRLKVMQRWGGARPWFFVHMLLGVFGPVAILVHSGFVVGSVNAGVALYSMLIVAGSGVMGRFLYIRIHRDWNGSVQTLDRLREELGLHGEETRHRFGFAPAVENLLQEAERAVANPPTDLLRHLHAFVTLPLQQRRRAHRARKALDRALRELATREGWAHSLLRVRQRSEQDALKQYFRQSLRVAQYDSAKRLFALWHVLHIPFVYIMVLCAVVHVVAVHIY